MVFPWLVQFANFIFVPVSMPAALFKDHPAARDHDKERDAHICSFSSVLKLLPNKLRSFQIRTEENPTLP